MLLWSLHHTPYSDIHALYVLCPIIHHHTPFLDAGIQTGINYGIFFSQNGEIQISFPDIFSRFSPVPVSNTLLSKTGMMVCYANSPNLFETIYVQLLFIDHNSTATFKEK